MAGTSITDIINIKLKHQCGCIRCWYPNMPNAAKLASSHEARTPAASDVADRNLHASAVSDAQHFSLASLLYTPRPLAFHSYALSEPSSAILGSLRRQPASTGKRHLSTLDLP